MVIRISKSYIGRMYTVEHNDETQAELYHLLISG